MKYVALLSGGKDSCYNIVHCDYNGHELIAAASLRPGSGKEELDSYLYQTVGQDGIEWVARALDVPLYRRIIAGQAIEQGPEYGARDHNNSSVEGDETEDLYELLYSVKSQHPDVKGVSVGAILSNYQRVRVEHVCRRLNLIPLCYLWQRDQTELLSEMVRAGMNAILIKIAGIGLTKRHLGMSIAQMQPTLLKLNSLYGSHVCGEGGEYETYTLDCPAFKSRITLIDTEVVPLSENDVAPVAFLRLKEAHLEAKVLVEDHSFSVPPLLEEEYKVLDNATSLELSTTPVTSQFRHPVLQSRTSHIGSWFSVSNVTGSGQMSSIEEEVRECFHKLAEALAKHDLQLADCSMINICVSSMDLFQRVNETYASFFGSSPPARACVGVDLPPPHRILLEAIAFAETRPGDRKSLHVQSLSYWAPANIGPYSQAITAGERVFISGQIGLIPAQLSLPDPRSLALEMALSCQHVSRVAKAVKDGSGGNWVGHTQMTIYWMSYPSSLDDVRVGHLALPEAASPTLFLTVKELPKGALVEKQVLLHTGRQGSQDEDGGTSSNGKAPLLSEDEIFYGDGKLLAWEVSRLEDQQSSCTILLFKGDLTRDATTSVVASLSYVLQNALSARYFYRLESYRSHHKDVLECGFGEALPITYIPCRRISSVKHDDWDAAICIISGLCP